ncbi:uncharacterized protein LOC144710285 isoform X2 [Wolffia australiana]
MEEEEVPLPILEENLGKTEVRDEIEGMQGEFIADVHPPMDRAAILKAMELVERDSAAIADSFVSLFSTLRGALSEASSISVEHMQCFSDVIGRLQESVLDAATKGNRYMNSCLRLNEELKGMESLAVQLKILRKNIDFLDSAVNHLLRH